MTDNDLGLWINTVWGYLTMILNTEMTLYGHTFKMLHVITYSIVFGIFVSLLSTFVKRE